MRRLLLKMVLMLLVLVPAATVIATQRAGELDPVAPKALAPFDEGFVPLLAGSWEGRGIVADSRSNFAFGRCRMTFTNYGTGSYYIEPLPVPGPGSTITAPLQVNFDYVVVGDAVLISQQMTQPLIGATNAMLAVRVTQDKLEFVSANGGIISAIGGGLPVGYALKRVR